MPLLVAALLPCSIASPLPHGKKPTPSPPTALPRNATANDLRWQPSLDFGKNGCYNVPAVDKDSKVAQGLPHNWATVSGHCHDLSDLANNNVYSRQRCNSGWCVYLYDYYFEKDVVIQHSLDFGHTHDWEHVAVWVQDDQPRFVGASQHGKYKIKAAADVRWDGDHPKLVYYKGPVNTHSFRFANAKDEAIKNDLHEWFRGDLVSYNGFPPGVRDSLYAHNFGKASVALKDSSFPGNIERALPKGVVFDANKDEGSPGTP